MNIEDAMNKVKDQPNQGETLTVVGSIEKEADSGKIRVCPDPHNLSRYVLIDPRTIAGDVLDVTEHKLRARNGRDRTRLGLMERFAERLAPQRLLFLVTLKIAAPRSWPYAAAWASRGRDF